MESNKKPLGNFVDDDQMVISGDVEVEFIDQGSYWERVENIGDGGAGFARTEIPDTQVLPDPTGRSAEVLKRVLVQNRGIIHQLQHSSLFELSQRSRSPSGSAYIILRVDVPVGGADRAKCCSQTPELAFETIVDRFFEKGEILKFYIAVDRSLQDVAHMSMPDVGAEIGDLSLTDPKSKPTEKELMETMAESGIHHVSNIRSFDESNYTNESSETNDNSPPEEQIVDIEYDASEIDDGTDFETEMYKVANQTEDEDHIGEVVEYNPDMDDESVEIVVRCPDQSIGLLEYDFPETESASNSAFVSMINCARETKLVADDEGNIEQTYAEITLDSIERLKNAEIPLKEHKNSWVVATSNELDTDGSDNDSTEANGSADPRQQVADMLSQRFKGWASSTALTVGRAMFWITALPFMAPIFLLSKAAADGDTVNNFVSDTHTLFNVEMKICIAIIGALMWYGMLSLFLL